MNNVASSESRRKAPRFDAVFAVELSSKQKSERCGVTRNVSALGALLVTPSRFDVGDAISMILHVGATKERLSGRVVRVEENGAASTEVWRYRLGVAFDSPVSEALFEAVQPS